MNRKRAVVFITALAVCTASLAGSAAPLAGVKVLDLATAQKIALADNTSLAAAAARVEQAQHRVAQARSLYWPSVDAGGTATASRRSKNDATSQAMLSRDADIDRDTEKYSVSLGASWLLFDGFSRKFANRIAEYGQQESEQARRDGMRLLLQSVAEAYYRAQLAQYNRVIAEADLSFNATQEDEAKISMDAGAGSLSAVLNFQVQMNNASTDILLAEQDYDLALYALAVLLGNESGKMPENLVLADVEMVDAEAFYELSQDTLVQSAIANRPDLLRQQFSLQRTESIIGAKQAAFYPQVLLHGSVNGSRVNDVRFEGEDLGSTVSVNFSYNLFRGGLDHARLAEAKAAKREEIRTFEQQRNKVQSEVLQAITRLKQSRAQLELQRASVKLVEQSRDLVEEGYKAGQESLARLNEVQRNLVRTQSRLAVSLISLYLNRQGLRTATGESLIPYLTRDTVENEHEFE